MYYESDMLVQSKKTGEFFEIQAIEENGLLVLSDGISRFVANQCDIELIETVSYRPDNPR